MTARRSRNAARLAVAASAAVWFAETKPARASQFVLVWDAPPACPAGEVVRRSILAQLGAERRGMTLKASATVTQTPTAFRVQLHTDRKGQRGVRELEASTCEALVDAIAVILALAVDPVARGSSDASAEDPPASDSQAGAPEAAVTTSASASRAAAPGTSTRAPRSDSPPIARSEGATSPSAESTTSNVSESQPPVDDSAGEPARTFTELGLQGVASIAGSVESGVLPGLGFGVTARGGARFRRVRTELAISRWFSRQSTSTEGRGADVDGLSLAGWGCFRAVPAHTAAVPRLRSALPPDDAPAIEAGPCVGAEVGRLHAQSFGISDPSEGSGAYLAAGGALRLGATAADWLSLDVRFEALRVLHRPEFEVRNLGAFYEPSPWSLRAALGAEAYFP